MRRKVALEGVQRVFGASLSPREQRQLVRRVFQHTAMGAVESLRLPDLTAERAAALVERRGYPVVQEARARGKGVILVSAHLGSYDLAACSQAAQGLPVHVVYREIEWPAAQAFFSKVRAATGIGAIAPRDSWQDMKDVLRRGGFVGFMVDQHMLPHRGVVTTFFGQLASTTPAPVRLSLQTGAPIVPVVMERVGNSGRHVLHCGPEFVLEAPCADVEANVLHDTERLNRWVEDWIRRSPHEWLWMHRRWKVHDRPEGWDVPEMIQEKVRGSRPAWSHGQQERRVVT